jgi:hypothetical protein
MTRHVRLMVTVALLVLAHLPVMVSAQSGSGQFKADKLGTIAVQHSVAYVVRDQSNARVSQVEILLTDVAIDPKVVHSAFDPHMAAINLDALDDRNYVLLWVKPDGTVTMNATFSKTMTQFLDSTRGEGLVVTWTTRSATRLAGRAVTKAPRRTMDGSMYSLDVTFDVDVPAGSAATPLPAGGGEPGKALRALLAAADRKDWTAIRAGSSVEALKTFDRSYNTPAENAESAAELLKAWLSTDKLEITGGVLESDMVAVLDAEGELFPGQRTLTRVRMIKAADVWKFDRAARAGMVP